MYFKLWRSTSDHQWYFSLFAKNHEIIASSEGYESRQGALKGVRAVRRACFAKLREVL
jgi:uncharacterized protein YegP (UPF0339 family)